MEECTFSPKINKKNDSEFLNINKKKENVHVRLYNTYKEKQENIEKNSIFIQHIQMEKLDKELKNHCTFQPNVRINNKCPMERFQELMNEKINQKKINHQKPKAYDEKIQQMRQAQKEKEILKKKKENLFLPNYNTKEFVDEKGRTKVEPFHLSTNQRAEEKKRMYNLENNLEKNGNINEKKRMYNLEKNNNIIMAIDVYISPNTSVPLVIKQNEDVLEILKKFIIKNNLSDNHFKTLWNTINELALKEEEQLKDLYQEKKTETKKSLVTLANNSATSVFPIDNNNSIKIHEIIPPELSSISY